MKKISLDGLSEYRLELMGIAATSILFMHCIQAKILYLPYEIGNKILVLWGTFGVDIFAILSGMGIYYSLYNRDKNIKWLKKRFLRVLIPFWIIAIPVYALLHVNGMLPWIFKMTTLEY